MKQRVIFLDVASVLSGYGFWFNTFHSLLWQVQNKFFGGQCPEVVYPDKICKNKVKKLSKIVKRTNAKVVLLNSSYNGLEHTQCTVNETFMGELLNLLDRYKIKVLDKTPESLSHKRGNEVISWLASHEDEVDSFVVISADKTDLWCFEDKELVQTSQRLLGNVGLQRKHVHEAIKVLA